MAKSNNKYLPINLQHRIIRILSSGWFFIATLIIFVFETSWLALTSRFPMAFDEAYHFGLIKFYTNHLNPIVTSQPIDTYRFGAIVQNPSFLYHYLMNFPYRLIDLFTKSSELQVIYLRFINIALVIATLLILRRLLRFINLSKATTNVLLFIFALTPTVTALSAQINYDNLLILLTSACLYETARFITSLKKGEFDTTRFLILVSLSLFASLVKFAFLPILLALAVIVTWIIYRFWHKNRKNFIAMVGKGFSANRYLNWFSVAILLLGLFLFARFYGVNTIKYHSPVPVCNQVASVSLCKHYYAWDHNYKLRQYALAHPNVPKMNVFEYGAYWSIEVSLYSFGSVVPVMGTIYITLFFGLLVALLALVGILLTLKNFKKIIKREQELSLLVLIGLVYILFLAGRSYFDYMQLAHPASIDGRYLVPVLIYFYAVLAVGTLLAVKPMRSGVYIKTGLSVIVILGFLFFGGFTQYILHVTPEYGRLSPTNDFYLQPSQ